MITPAQKLTLNKLQERTSRLAELPTNLDRTEKVVAVTYDFSVSGGAVGDISLGYSTEEACLVTKVLTHEITNCTSGGSATVTLAAGATGLTGATAVASVATGTVALAGAATAIAVASGEALKVTIGTAALTAGKIRFYVYMIPQRDM